MPTAPAEAHSQPAAKPAHTARPVRKAAPAEKSAAPKPTIAPAAKPIASAAPKPAEKPATTTPAAKPAASAASTREQNIRLARARATQRARQANLISAENYSYVLGDLKLVAGLAITAFVVLIALTYVMPH